MGTRLTLIALQQIRAGLLKRGALLRVQAANTLLGNLLQNIVDRGGFLSVFQNFDLMLVGQPLGLLFFDPIGLPMSCHSPRQSAACRNIR